MSKKSLRICLVNPPVLAVLEPWYDKPDFPRTALACLAAYIQDIPGVELLIVDGKFEQLNFEQCIQKIEAFKADLVGFTAFTNEIKPAAYLAHKLKEKNKQILTLIGGVHVTAIPKQSLIEFPSFDMAVVGEGESPLKELCESLLEIRSKPLKEIKGLCLRQENEIILNGHADRILDLDELPMPAWELFKPAKTYFIQSLRGCPFNCQFCMNPNGQVARKRSVENVIKELHYIIDTFHPKHISFGDELFSVDMNRTHDLLDAMIEHKIGDKVSWDVQTHVKFVDQEMFYKFKKAKVERVEIGVETGDVEIMKKMGKGISLSKIMDAYNFAKNAKVPIGTFFIIGQPNETVQSINKTIDLAVELNPDLPMFGLMTPYPGTEVARIAAKGEGGYRLKTTDWDNYSKQLGGALEFADLSKRQIEWLQIKAYTSVFLKNRRWFDFLKLVWNYRTGAFELLKKFLLGRKELQAKSNKPKDYDLLFKKSFQVDKFDFINSRETWLEKQKEEIQRTRKEMPNLFKLGE
ncbi:MAG: radical SAM protein [Chitinophagales bacterium]|nr:radical SAM protein [Chitinophagales bacterium]